MLRYESEVMEILTEHGAIAPDTGQTTTGTTLGQSSSSNQSELSQRLSKYSDILDVAKFAENSLHLDIKFIYDYLCFVLRTLINTRSTW